MGVDRIMLKEGVYSKFKYILYIPSEEEDLPLITVLHGSGEVGSKLSKLKAREPYISLKKGLIKPNAIVLMPQLPTSSWGMSAVALKKLIDHIATEYKCDINRISITGHSLGGAGVFDMLLKYPDYFSAAASLSPCKVYTQKQLKPIKDIPIWIFYGQKEGKYGQYSRTIKNRLDALGGNAILTCVKNKGHAIQSCWISDTYELMEWLLNQEQIIEVNDGGI